MLTGNSAGLVYRPHRRWDKDLRRVAATQQARLLGYQPETSISDGLRHTAHWFDQQWDRIQADAKF
jgi:UDP-glucose 4-epimerase